MSRNQLDVNGIGSRLREERERRAWSQQECGQLGGVTRATQARYESGLTLPTLEYLAKLSETGINLAFVLAGDAPSAQDVAREDLQLFGKAIKAVCQLASSHNFDPPDEATTLVVMKTFRNFKERGAERAQPQLNDFFHLEH